MLSRLSLLSVLLLALPACSLAPSAASASASEPGVPVSATPVRLVIPAGLATGASAETIDVVTDQTGAPWDVAPAHLQLTFAGYALEGSFHVPQLFAYPAPEYAAMNSAAAESLKRLREVLANPSASYDKDTLPRVPFFNAGQVFAAQHKVIHFSGGSGVRFVTQYAQDTSPINNTGLFYYFAGLSDDGKYYIVAILPASLPFLPAGNNPDATVPSGGIPFPSSSSPGSSLEAYYAQVAQRIDAASPDQFTPPLSSLDALLQSLQVDH